MLPARHRHQPILRAAPQQPRSGLHYARAGEAGARGVAEGGGVRADVRRRAQQPRRAPTRHRGHPGGARGVQRVRASVPGSQKRGAKLPLGLKLRVAG